MAGKGSSIYNGKTVLMPGLLFFSNPFVSKRKKNNFKTKTGDNNGVDTAHCRIVILEPKEERNHLIQYSFPQEETAGLLTGTKRDMQLILNSLGSCLFETFELANPLKQYARSLSWGHVVFLRKESSAKD